MPSKFLSRILPFRQKKERKLSFEDIEYLEKKTALNREELKDKYDTFVTNHSKGVMSKKSFDSMMKQSYPKAKTRKISEHVFRMYDTNADGHVDFKEFIVALEIFRNGSPEENLKQLFRILDIDDDGSINIREMMDVLRDIHEISKIQNMKTGEDWMQVANEVFAEMDENGDGVIDEEEFVSACLTQKKFSKTVVLQIIQLLEG